MSTTNYIYPVLRRLGWPGRLINRWLLRCGFWDDSGEWDDEAIWVVVGLSSNTADTCRILLYDSDSSGYPNELLYESETIGTGDITGEKFVLVTTPRPVLTKGSVYWFGVHNQAQFSIRSKPQSSVAALGYSGLNASFVKIVRVSQPYASGAPAIWNFGSSDLSGGALPDIRFRVVEI